MNLAEYSRLKLKLLSGGAAWRDSKKPPPHTTPSPGGSQGHASRPAPGDPHGPGGDFNLQVKEELDKKVKILKSFGGGQSEDKSSLKEV